MTTENHQSENTYQTAIVACGCFWGVEYWFHKLNGVIKATSGYTGGTIQNPTYRQVCSGNSGHLEAVEVVFDPAIISFEEILKFFYEIHDFSQSDGQGADRGSQYLSAIFFDNQQELATAQKLKSELEELGHRVATLFLPATIFYPAEEYHQNYYTKSGGSPYCHFKKKIWNY